MSVTFIFVLLLGKLVNCYLDISSDNSKKVISHDNSQNDEKCNSDLVLIKNNANPGGKIEAEAFGVTNAGGEADAAGSVSIGAVAGAIEDLPCSAPLGGYQQDDPILVRLLDLHYHAWPCTIVFSPRHPRPLHHGHPQRPCDQIDQGEAGVEMLHRLGDSNHQRLLQLLSDPAEHQGPGLR